MILVKSILHNMTNLHRRKDTESLIDIYEEAKEYILDIEKKEGAKKSYFSKDASLKRDVNKEYQEMLVIREKENEDLKSQLEIMSSLKEQFELVNKKLSEMESVTKKKDTKIKSLENKLNKIDGASK